ncbi:MAG: DUF1579 domain-containing protein [Phycisphaeraceae bacterium]|nr:DUF1579 domain-containing protein [Phycisphaeraceae bacterium]
MKRHSRISLAIVAATVSGTLALALGATAFQGGGATPPNDVIPPLPTVPTPGEGAPPVELPAIPGMDPAMMKDMVPGPQHAWLAERVGKWTFTGTMVMGPGVTIDVRGSTTYSMILGGRFLQESMEMKMGEMPYRGIGTTGYSNGLEEFQMTWMGEGSTTMTVGSGKRSDDGRTLNATYQMFDPAHGAMMTTRSVETTIDNDNFKFAMYGPGPDGKETLMFEFMYTREAPTRVW